MAALSLILKVPPTNNQNYWFDFVNNSLKKCQDTLDLIVDFNEVKFLETDDFVVLACLIESFIEKGCKSIKFIGGTKEFNAHLENIKFKKYWEPGFNRTRFTVSRNRTTLCLWKVDPEMVYSYSVHAREYFERNFLKKKDLLPLASNLDEVFNNILDHAQSEIQGYIITQFYPKNNQLSFSVCDFGIGIPKSINTYFESRNEPKLEDWQTIIEAIKLGFSVKSNPKNRGFGLDNILQLTESSNGSLIIRSNRGYFEKSANKNFIIGDMPSYFPGTLIKVRMDLNTFEEKDENDEIFEF